MYTSTPETKKMNRYRKLRELHSLSAVFLQTRDKKMARLLIDNIYEKVKTCPYPEHLLDDIENTFCEFTPAIGSYINKLPHMPPKKVKARTYESLAVIINLINFSEF
ncbi:hypothetical protein [Sinomicrobium sp. M5D2P17]